MTRLYQLVMELQNEDSHIGDLCNAILSDMQFPKFESQDEQITYLMKISASIPNSTNAITEFMEIFINNYNDGK